MRSTPLNDQINFWLNMARLVICVGQLVLVILILINISGCKSNPPLPEPPKVVRVPVKEFVPLPPQLTAPCAEVAKKGNSYGEAIRLANQRLASLQECNKRLAEIRKLGEKP